MNRTLAKQMTSDLIQKAKAMQTFKIVRLVPEGFEFNGPVPFHLEINAKGIMTVTVHALDSKEAHRQVDEYLRSCCG